MNKKVREEFEKAYPMPFACGWNSMTSEYECIWYEHAGETDVEAAIVQHNDRLAVWASSREAVVVELPSPSDHEIYNDKSDFLHIDGESLMSSVRYAIEAQGLKVNP